jgi:hypothetical protein
VAEPELAVADRAARRRRRRRRANCTTLFPPRCPPRPVCAQAQAADRLN